MNQDHELNYKGFQQLGNNNLHMHFVRGGEYREQEHFRKFQEANPELEQRLTDEFAPAWKEFPKIPWGFERLMDRFRPQLYDAYRLMRVYVERDEILFR